MSKSIKFKNNIYLDSSSVAHNKKPLNEVLTPNYMMIGKSVEPLKWSTQDTWQPMDFKTKITSSGNKLIHEGNEIKIGEGVSKVRVTAQILYDVSGLDQASNYLFMRISNNNVGKSKSITGMLRWGTLHTEAVFNVSKNDIIKCDVLKSNNKEIGFYDYTQNFDSGNGCYLIVEVIE